MLINDLKKIGLSNNEAKLYLAALELGETNISRLAKKSEIKRTTAYSAIESLKEKGLLSSIKKGNQINYYAESPEKIEESIDEKKQTIQKMMPELLAFSNLIDKKPKIRYFEGKDAYQEVFKDILKYPHNEVLAWFDEKFRDYNFFSEHFIPQRKKNKIWVRAIFPKNEQTKKILRKDMDHLRKSKLIPSKNFKMDIEINLYGKNKIGIISYDEQLAIIIESKKIFDAQKNIFETMWSLI